MLINSDTLKFQRVIIDYDRETSIFGFCQNFIIFIKIRTRGFFISKRIIKIKSVTIILPSATIQIPVIYKNIIPKNRFYLFEPEYQQNFAVGNGIFAHMVDANLFFVQMYNVLSIPVHLPNKTRFGSFVEYNQNGTYHVVPIHVFLVIKNVRSWKSKTIKLVIRF